MRSTEPIPPQAPRTDARARIERELWLARDAGEHQLVAELAQRLAALNAPGTAQDPGHETAAAEPPRRQTNARTAAKKTARPKPARSSRRVPRQ